MTRCIITSTALSSRAKSRGQECPRYTNSLVRWASHPPAFDPGGWPTFTFFCKGGDCEVGGHSFCLHARVSERATIGGMRGGWLILSF